jgi:hypothetical protein
MGSYGAEFYLSCGHTWVKRERSKPDPIRNVGCEACWWIEKSREPGLKTFWFAKVGYKLLRAFRWGEIMDPEFEGVFARKLLVVRAENLAMATKAAKRGEGHAYLPEEKQWHGLTPSPSCRRSARSV